MTSGVESGKVRKTEVARCAARVQRGGYPKGQVPQELAATPKDNEQTTNYMTRVSRGDRQACGALQQHYVLRVASFFRRHHRCEQTVEDLTQEVFGRVWEKRDKYRSGTADLAWLLGFARTILKETQCKDYLNQKTNADYPLDSIIDGRQASAHHQAGLQEQTQTLRNLMDRLPEKQRRAFELTCLKGLSSPEASVILACSAVTVRRNRHIGLVKIQAWLRAGVCQARKGAKIAKKDWK